MTCSRSHSYQRMEQELEHWILDSKLSSHYFVHSHQFSSVAQSCPTLQSHRLQHTRPPCPCPPITNIRSLLKLTSITSVMPSNHLILCHLLFLLPSIFLSIKVFSIESVLCIRWTKYWSFSFSISPSNEYLGLIPLGLHGLISLQSKGHSRVFSNTTVQKHQLFGAQPSL